MAGGDMATVKMIFRILTIIMIVVVFICYIAFSCDGGSWSWNCRGDAKLVIIFLFIIFFLILGLVGAIIEHLIIMVIFTVGWLIMNCVGYGVWYFWGSYLGTVMLIFAAVYTICLCMGSGGK